MKSIIPTYTWVTSHYICLICKTTVYKTKLNMCEERVFFFFECLGLGSRPPKWYKLFVVLYLYSRINVVIYNWSLRNDFTLRFYLLMGGLVAKNKMWPCSVISSNDITHKDWCQEIMICWNLEQFRGGRYCSLREITRAVWEEAS